MRGFLEWTDYRLRSVYLNHLDHPTAVQSVQLWAANSLNISMGISLTHFCHVLAPDTLEIWLYRDGYKNCNLKAISTQFKKLKHGSIIIGCWNFHQSVHLLQLTNQTTRGHQSGPQKLGLGILYLFLKSQKMPTSSVWSASVQQQNVKTQWRFRVHWPE